MATSIPVQFINLTQDEYDKLEGKRKAGRLYFTSDTKRIYRGDAQFTPNWLSNEVFDLNLEGEFKRMCVSIAKALGATVKENPPIPDDPNGRETALHYGITPDDNTTYFDIMNAAGLQGTDTLNKLKDN